jgi:hypothetical protein
VCSAIFPSRAFAMWSLYGRLVPADPDLFAELLALVQEDTGPPDDATPGRRWDIEILVEVDGEPHELIELRADGTIELEVISPGASSR